MFLALLAFLFFVAFLALRDLLAFLAFVAFPKLLAFLAPLAFLALPVVLVLMVFGPLLLLFATGKIIDIVATRNDNTVMWKYNV